MLIQFKVSNFLSFSEEQSISMIPTLLERDDLIKINHVKLLRKGVIFGANSSGKSNFIKAIAFGKELVLDGFSEKHRNQYSKITSINKNRETSFEYTLYINGKFYAYGFSFVLYDGRFTEEYLYEINEDDEEKLIFRRNQTEFVWDGAQDIEEIKRSIKEKPNCLFVSLSLSSKKLKDLSNIYEWFLDKLIVNFQNQEFLRLESKFMKNQQEFVKMLKAFDTGISEICFRKTNLENLKAHGDFIYNKILAEISRSQITFGIRLKDALYSFQYVDHEFEIYEIFFRHQYSDLDYEFREESDGTKRMFDLLDIIISPKPYAIYLIDEINRSIHPLLTEKYLAIYKLSLKENFVQLLFTTHESNLLREELLRHDEVWFVEKQKDNSSRLFSLDIFQRENEKDIGKAYLSGHYGGIPLLNKSGED